MKYVEVTLPDGSSLVGTVDVEDDSYLEVVTEDGKAFKVEMWDAD